MGKSYVFNKFGVVFAWMNDRPGDWRDQAVNSEDLSRWSNSWKRKLGWRAGLSFLRRDSEGNLMLVARHWPHLLCWQWFVLAGWNRRGMSRRMRVQLGYRQSTISFFGPFVTLHRQDSDHMPALGPYGDACPERIWVHQLEPAEAADDCLHA